MFKVNLEYLRRKSSQRYIPEIDALRFFAIIPVMLVHFSGALLTYNENFDRAVIDQENAFRHALITGNTGLYLFFAISGFILTLPFIAKDRSQFRFKNYYLRRLVRIEPPYLIAITMFFVVHIALGEKSIEFLFERYLASFFYVSMMIYEARPYILPVSTSLEIEIQFYLLMPLLLILLKLIDNKIWRGIIYTLLLLSTYFINLFPFHELNDFMRFFLSGIIAADVYKHFEIRRHYIWDAVFIIDLPLLFIIPNHFIMSILLFLIIISSTHTVFLKRFLTGQLITIIGGMCYSLYLLHYPLFHLFMRLFTNKLSFFESFEANYLFQATIFIPLSIVLISGYFILIEKPFMFLSQKVGRDKDKTIKSTETV
ncbi:O-acetyltransferase OatA [Arenibacter sp. NBRC 103722]|uniref:acyltransferase family protein n=1 Tax=Arenibacter sp. NBRC 103722 TaxID=1113929 RepID=UPI000853A5F7|nr:acyltransferase [Arenibacter sp. NBRC 103722]GBF20061.1 O-acetyltransferase OatA [Arenibacter sp. NBRC 103722]